eukprot:4734760-Pleurochrysis_carterae.AAC.1
MLNGQRVDRTSLCGAITLGLGGSAHRAFSVHGEWAKGRRRVDWNDRDRDARPTEVVAHVLQHDLALCVLGSARVLRGPRDGELRAGDEADRRRLVGRAAAVAVPALGVVLAVKQPIVVVPVAAAFVQTVVAARRVVQVDVGIDGRGEEREDESESKRAGRAIERTRRATPRETRVQRGKMDAHGRAALPAQELSALFKLASAVVVWAIVFLAGLPLTPTLQDGHEDSSSFNRWLALERGAFILLGPSACMAP